MSLASRLTFLFNSFAIRLTSNTFGKYFWSLFSMKFFSFIRYFFWVSSSSYCFLAFSLASYFCIVSSSSLFLSSINFFSSSAILALFSISLFYSSSNFILVSKSSYYFFIISSYCLYSSFLCSSNSYFFLSISSWSCFSAIFCYSYLFSSAFFDISCWANSQSISGPYSIASPGIWTKNVVVVPNINLSLCVSLVEPVIGVPFTKINSQHSLVNGAISITPSLFVIIAWLGYTHIALTTI